MKTTMVLLAGALFASAMMAADGQLAEERYKGKYGRYTPTKEAAMKAAQPVVLRAAACCELIAERGRLALSNNEERFHAKFGRYSTAREAQMKVERETLAANSRKCTTMPQCLEMPAIVEQTAPALSESAARSVAKYGRLPVGSEPALLAVSNQTCEHSCCQ